jgi:SAM-dependent methyltransferase
LFHRILVKSCRSYQSLFLPAFSEERELTQLHEKSKGGRAFLEAYFQHEFEKGPRILESFARFENNWESSKVLDFGCGAGGLTTYLGCRFREAWGIDVDADKIEFGNQEAKARSRRNVTLVAYDGKKLPFEAGSFDYVFSVDVMEHLPEPSRFVAEFARVLRQGGLFLVSFGPQWRHPHGKHMWNRLPGWWTHLLFPTAVVMEVLGYPSGTTWEELGLHRLTASAFAETMKHSALMQRMAEYSNNRRVSLLIKLPFVRDLFISGFVGVFEKP